MYKLNVPPIGQGCCVEQLISIGDESVRIIFDCGTTSSQSF